MYYFGDKYGRYLYSHNNYTEILSSLGIIGFVIYYGWYLNELMKYKNIRNRECDMWKFTLLFIIVTLILDYGTVSFDKIHYLLMQQIISISNKKVEKVK